MFLEKDTKMVVITRTFDKNRIKKLCSEGCVRLMRSGYIAPESIETAIEDPRNHFVIAEDGERDLGFIVFSELGNGEMSIHVCLKTIGTTTRKIIRDAISFAYTVFCCDRLYAYYPKARRAVDKLANDLGFVDAQYMAKRFNIRSSTDLVWKTLDLTNNFPCHS